VRAGSFHAPAWLMLPLWFLSELFMAQMHEGDPRGMTVAHWAHAWGFVFGAAVAYTFRVSRLEQRYLAPALEARANMSCDAEIRRAQHMLRKKQTVAACSILESKLLKEPGNVEAADLYWETGVQFGRAAQQRRLFLRLIKEDIKRGCPDVAMARWRKLREAVPDVKPDPELALGLAGVFMNEHPEEARGLVETALEGFSLQTGHESLVELARVAHKIRHSKAREAMDMALGHPGLPDHVRDDLRTLYSR
jgi:hypothetical protein